MAMGSSGRPRLRQGTFDEWFSRVMNTDVEGRRDSNRAQLGLDSSTTIRIPFVGFLNDVEETGRSHRTRPLLLSSMSSHDPTTTDHQFQTCFQLLPLASRRRGRGAGALADKGTCTCPDHRSHQILHADYDSDPGTYGCFWSDNGLPEPQLTHRRFRMDSTETGNSVVYESDPQI